MYFIIVDTCEYIDNPVIHIDKIIVSGRLALETIYPIVFQGSAGQELDGQLVQFQVDLASRDATITSLQRELALERARIKDLAADLGYKASQISDISLSGGEMDTKALELDRTKLTLSAHASQS